MNGNSKVAFFDFCETLVDFQTAGAFVDYVRERLNYLSINARHSLFVFIRRTKVIPLLDRKTGGRFSICKRIKLYQIKGVQQDLLEQLAKDFYYEKVRPHLIPQVVERMKTLQGDGFSVGLVSGGYGIYLKYFVAEFGLQFCYSSNIGFSNGKCTGQMSGPDCMRENKVLILKEKYGTPPAESFAFSDSISDFPLLQWVAKGIVVSHGRHQHWIDNHQLNEIIWD